MGGINRAFIASSGVCQSRLRSTQLALTVVGCWLRIRQLSVRFRFTRRICWSDDGGLGFLVHNVILFDKHVAPHCLP